MCNNLRQTSLEPNVNVYMHMHVPKCKCTCTKHTFRQMLVCLKRNAHATRVESRARNYIHRSLTRESKSIRASHCALTPMLREWRARARGRPHTSYEICCSGGWGGGSHERGEPLIARICSHRVMASNKRLASVCRPTHNQKTACLLVASGACRRPAPTNA